MTKTIPSIFAAFIVAFLFIVPDIPWGPRAHAQQRVHVRFNDWDNTWDAPIVSDSVKFFDVTKDEKTFQIHVGDDVIIPFAVDKITEVTFLNEPETETKDPYQVFQLFINTNDGSDITSKEEYTPCQLMLNARGSFGSFSASAGIRGRGNSSWLWYDKKPYRIKLDNIHKMLGMDKAKSWVLLANYRDVTDLMNTFVFSMGEWMGLPYTNHTRYVELFINGDYKGVYQLTEQVQQHENRVAVSEDGGILLTLDVDDGPGENPYADDNFYTKVYRMPAAVKFPKDEYATENTVDSVRTEFAKLERAIKDKNYEEVEKLLDIPSFIKYLQIQEFIYNVELSAPRSIYMHKDGAGKWVMGPLWDFDAGYDFDWSNMYTGHRFFDSYRETVMGPNPYKRNGNYSYVPQFFTDLFGCKPFVEAYKAQWNAVKDDIVGHNWEECMKYVTHLREGAMDREQSRWPLNGYSFDTEIGKMHRWLLKRRDFMTELIANIPIPDDTPITDSRFCGTISTEVEMNWYYGYHQTNMIHVDKDEVMALMGLTSENFKEANVTIVPLMTDGSEGSNGTNGVFGGWFDEEGNPGPYARGHVYIEVFSDLWNWSCGLYKEQCYDSEHTVTMQIQYPHDGTLLKVNIEVNFRINFDW